MKKLGMLAQVAGMVRVLCLHGFETNGGILKIQLEAFAQWSKLAPAVEFAYLDGPLRRDPAGVHPALVEFFPGEDYRAWWNFETESDGSQVSALALGQN